MQEIMTDTSEAAWERAEDYPDGTLRTVLRRNDEGNPITVLLRLPPGFKMDSHSHTCVEQHFILAGSYEVAGARYVAGHYRMIPAQAEHGPFRSPDGAEILVVWEP